MTDLVFQNLSLGASVVHPIFTIFGYVEVFTRAAHRPHPITLLKNISALSSEKIDEGDIQLCACGRIYKHSHELEDEKSIERFDSWFAGVQERRLCSIDLPPVNLYSTANDKSNGDSLDSRKPIFAAGMLCFLTEL